MDEWLFVYSPTYSPIKSGQQDQDNKKSYRGISIVKKSEKYTGSTKRYKMFLLSSMFLRLFTDIVMSFLVRNLR